MSLLSLLINLMHPCLIKVKQKYSIPNLLDNAHMFLWLSALRIALAAQRLWVRFPGNTHTDKTCIARMHCKSLWIKVSAKCINALFFFRKMVSLNPRFV